MRWMMLRNSLIVSAISIGVFAPCAFSQPEPADSAPSTTTTTTTTTTVTTTTTTVNPSTPSKTHRIAVLRFKGPEDVSTDSDLAFKIKSGEFSEYKDDFDELGTYIQKAFASQLKEKLGTDSVVTVSGPPPTIDDDVTQKGIDAKYVLQGVIDKVRFEGNTFIPNYYELTLTAKLVSSTTGEAVWRVHHKLFARMFKTRREKDSAEVFNDMMAPHIAEKLSDEIATAAE